MYHVINPLKLTQLFELSRERSLVIVNEYGGFIIIGKSECDAAVVSSALRGLHRVCPVPEGECGVPGPAALTAHEVPDSHRGWDTANNSLNFV